MTYRLFVNDDRTLLVRVWEDGSAEFCVRPDPNATWGPPVLLMEETVDATS